MLLVIAGVMCCLAMSAPQVHLVAYSRDLDYGATRGAEMLSLMLGASLVSRVGFGWSADRNLLRGSTKLRRCFFTHSSTASMRFDPGFALEVMQVMARRLRVMSQRYRHDHP